MFLPDGTKPFCRNIFQNRFLALNKVLRAFSENIVIMGITDYDFRVNDKISLSCRELAQKIIEPNGIKIVF